MCLSHFFAHARHLLNTSPFLVLPPPCDPQLPEALTYFYRVPSLFVHQESREQEVCEHEGLRRESAIMLATLEHMFLEM